MIQWKHGDYLICVIFLLIILPSPMMSTKMLRLAFLALGCITVITTLDIRYPGYDCQEKIANGTVLHHIYFPNGSSEYYCCYPVVCNRGDIEFCSEDLRSDQCIPCAGPHCNYKNISSQHVVQKDGEFCREKCIYGTPVVKFDQPEQTRHRGDNVTLNAFVKADNVVKHSHWIKNRTVIAMNIYAIDTNKYTVETSQNKTSLTITDLHWSDTGIYSLEVTDSAGNSGNGSINVNVVSRPLVTMKTHDHADAGSTFDVRCRVDGNSLITSMTFKYKKEQTRQLNVSLHDGVLKYTIYNTSSKDVGYYSCIAENSEGKEEKSMYLSVYSKPDIKFPDNRTFTFYVGDTMSILIFVTYQPQPAELICRYHGSTKTLPLNEIPNNGIWKTFVVVIANVQPHDGGNVTCKATNRLGTTHSELYIIVKLKEGTVRTDQQQTEAEYTADYKTAIVISSIGFLLGFIIVLVYVCRAYWGLEKLPCRTAVSGSIMSLMSIVILIISLLHVKSCNADCVAWILISVMIVTAIVVLIVLFYDILRQLSDPSAENQGNSPSAENKGNPPSNNLPSTPGSGGFSLHSQNGEAGPDESNDQASEDGSPSAVDQAEANSSTSDNPAEPLLDRSKNDLSINDFEETSVLRGASNQNECQHFC